MTTKEMLENMAELERIAYNKGVEAERKRSVRVMRKFVTRIGVTNHNILFEIINQEKLYKKWVPKSERVKKG